MATQTISPTQLAELAKNNPTIVLIDVRTPAEYAEVHIEFAKNIPLDTLDAKAVNSGSDPVYIVCQRGSRGQKACEKLAAAGLANVVNVEGGTLACVDAGLPVVRGRAMMSLERQVRIVTGTLVFLGIALIFLHIGFLTISAFVGVGLVFAGITNTCAMGMLVARMPWNRRTA